MPPPPPLPPPRRGPRRWCFTWEALAHLPTLRLFLFTSSVRPSDRCTNLKASLRLDSSHLLVTWAEEGSGELSLCVPVPRVLIDPCSPVECVAREDHVEAKLTLVLPLDHPMSMNLLAALDAGGGAAAGREDDLSECPVPLSLGSDIKSLSAGDVHFYCRTCCARLTKRPQRNFVEMPSANWREVADNWFGSCCCSFGGASEKLVHEYIKAYDCSVATCMLDGPSVIICKDNLDGFELQKSSREEVDYSNMFDTVAKSEGICNATDSEVNFNSCGSPCFLPQNDGGLIDDHTEHSLNDRKVTINADADLDSSADRVFPKDLVHCCVDVTHNLLNHVHGRPPDVSVAFSKMQPSMGNLSFLTRNCSHNGSLGSSFLIKTFNLSNEVHWVEFLCRQCSSFLGSYPIVMGVNSPLDGGIRLFKCYISTSMDVGGPHNLFRKHTLQRVFVNLLLESATDDLSFRTLVRDLGTKSPVLQIILLNSKAWCFSGNCLENETYVCLPEVHLQPVVKVLFSDCTTETEVNSRAVEQWVTKNHADEVYMMACQTKELVESLKLANDSLPPRYSLFQGMALSYIER